MSIFLYNCVLNLEYLLTKCYKICFIIIINYCCDMLRQYPSAIFRESTSLSTCETYVSNYMSEIRNITVQLWSKLKLNQGIKILTNQCMVKYRVIKKSLCTWQLQYKNTQNCSILNGFIKEYIRNMNRPMLNTVFENTVRRVNKCLETGWGHFEHYL